ncbi:FHA domain-containing protein [Stieleria varia]|uniref:FHA domain protein n=1 Tax=Stieleria varia TaxID=2528005 RepID=A0A5C6AJA4_9BACT|nr:FHA domain-containing protein [Stieleria varia]TWT98313.1 FHA domain protein [Stieleria varia]
MNVELTLNVGSPGGTIAPLQEGYYMIGRHRECQIRPKSKSVSRRHCLILNNEDGLGILDLESTRGTQVNGKRLHPKTWHRLNHGDLVRCGKVTIEVSISQPNAKSNGKPQSTSKAHAKLSLPDDSIARQRLASIGTDTPESWHSVDVEMFLSPENIDDENILGQGVEDPSQDSDEIDPATISNEAQTADRQVVTAATSDGAKLSQDTEDLSIFADTPLDDDESASSVDLFNFSDDEGGSNKGGANADGANADGGTHVDSTAESTSESKPPAPKKTKPLKPHKIPKPKRPKGPSRLPSFSLSSLSGDTDTWKMVAAGALALCLLGFAAYQAVGFFKGPEVRVLRDLD